MFEDTMHELNEDFMIVTGLETDETYEIRVVAVDGDFSTYSDTEEIDTYYYGHVRPPLSYILYRDLL